MNKIKEILHKYLCEDAIIICELCEKADDFVWLEENGYYVRKTGKETEKGKAYTKKHNELIEKHSRRIRDNSFDPENLSKLNKELREYIKKHPDYNIYKGLTESESFAFRHVYYDNW